MRQPHQHPHGRTGLRTLGVAALLAAGSGAASAQSSLTVYGVVDASLAHGSGSISNKTQVFSGSLLGSRIGFRGIEDLGGGLAASFVLESGLNADSGTGAATSANNQANVPAGQGISFNRMAYVSLSGGWGELRLGRDYTPSFMAQALHDPDSVGSGLWIPQSALGSLSVLAHPAGVRASNAVNYLIPKFGGLTGQVMWATGENASNAGATKNDGNLMGVRLAYNAGALDLGLAAQTIKQAAVGDIKTTVVGANYNFGVAKLWTQYIRETTHLANKMNGQSVAVSVPLGAAELRTAWSRSRLTNAAGANIGTTDKLALVGIYNLSKRTAVYGTLVHSRNKNGAAATPFPGVSVTGANNGASAYEVGIRHVF